MMHLWLVGLAGVEGAGGVDALLGRDLAHLVQILLPLHELVWHLLQSVLVLRVRSSALEAVRIEERGPYQVPGCPDWI